MTKKLLGLFLILVLAVSFCGIVSADILPAPPTLKLTVEMSPLTVYPPYMIYTAQLSYIPPISTTIPVCDFYNSPLYTTNDVYSWLGSAQFDKTGKAVISKQMKQGAYVAFAQTKINGMLIVSNKVEYKIP